MGRKTKVAVVGECKNVEKVKTLLTNKGYEVIAGPCESFPYQHSSDLSFMVFAGYNHIMIQSWHNLIIRGSTLPILFMHDPEGPPMYIHGSISIDCDGLTLGRALDNVAYLNNPSQMQTAQ